MGIGKRGSGPPRRPRNPVAKDVRTRLYRPRVEEDKRRQIPWKKKHPPEEMPDDLDMAEENGGAH